MVLIAHFSKSTKIFLRLLPSWFTGLTICQSTLVYVTSVLFANIQKTQENMLPLFLCMDDIKLQKQFWTNLKCFTCVLVFEFCQKLDTSLWSKKNIYISGSPTPLWKIKNSSLLAVTWYFAGSTGTCSDPGLLFSHFSSVVSWKAD